MPSLFAEQPTIRVDHDRCAKCGRCSEVCPSGTLSMHDGRIQVGRPNFFGCIGCGQCMAVCPTGAVEVDGRRLAAGDFLPLPEKAAAANAEQFDALLLRRRSIRKFAPQEVERRTVERILEMVATAPVGIPPSGVGLVVIHGREKVHRFAAESIAIFRRLERYLHPPFLWIFRWKMSKAEYGLMSDFVQPLLKLLADEWDAGTDSFTYDAPLALLFHHGPESEGADSHIAATYANLAAESLGLAGCLLGTSVALGTDKGFKAKYGIPAENKVALALVVGHPAVEYRRSVRRKMASVAWV